MELASAVSGLIRAPDPGLLWSKCRIPLLDSRSNRVSVGVGRSVKEMRDARRIASFVVNASSGGAEMETLVVKKTGLRDFKVLAGRPLPFGATACEDGVNFAVYSGSAEAATLCLFTLSDLKEVSLICVLSLFFVFIDLNKLNLQIVFHGWFLCSAASG